MPPPIADILTLSTTAPTGDTWTGTITQLRRGITLPGGIVAKDRDRSYALTLTLPARTGNRYQDIAFSGILRWGGTDASGVTTSADGKDLIGAGPGGNTMPLTGFDLLLTLGIAAGLLGIGGVCAAVGRSAA
jgi:hypothetical protein